MLLNEYFPLVTRAFAYWAVDIEMPADGFDLFGLELMNEWTSNPPYDYFSFSI